MPLELLVTPLARGAYFADTLAVARAELALVHPEAPVSVEQHATLTFLSVDLPATAAPELARLSFVQGVFERTPAGLQVLDADPGFSLPDGLVWGTKYRGKTHELVTQLALNAALAVASVDGPLLDPMAGRGTTLTWAVRYGLSATGIEQDAKAREHLQRHLKRQTKLLRLKHTSTTGSTTKKSRDGSGRFVEMRFPAASLRLVTGDSRHTRRLVQNQRFATLVTDLPYGVQFGGSGTRSPLAVVEAAADGWIDSLLPGGAMVLVYNRLQPRREALQAVFAERGLVPVPFEASHRMSESIWRDLLVFRKTP